MLRPCSCLSRRNEIRCRATCNYQSNPREEGSETVSFKTCFIFSIVAFLILVPASQAYGDQWTTKTSMSVSRSFLSTAVVNGTLYAIGGGLDLNSSTPAVEAYDVAANSWTRKADLPWTYCGTVACAVNNKIYVIGGAWSVLGSVVGMVYEYTPASNTWAKKADIPTARAFAAAGVVNGKIYVIGGASAELASAYNTVHEYNPATDTWTRKADMPTARFASSAAVVDGKIYVFGGATGIYLTGLSAVEAYDPATDTWTTKAPMPTSRYSHATDVVNGKIYAIGGGLGFGTASAVVEEYNPVSNAWATKTPMPTARWALAVATVGGKVYAIGGALASNAVLPTVEEYSPDVAAPGTPALADPADGTIGIAVTTALSWTAVSGGTTYRIQVSTVPGFTTILVDDSTLTGTSRQVGPLSNGAIYYWRVSAKNSGGTSAYSPVWSFTTIVAAPPAPDLVSPIDFAVGVSINPTLSWNAITGAVTYRVQVSPSPGFTTLLVDDSTVTGTSKAASGLTNSAIYYWRVSAENAGGTGVYSPTRSFTTIVALPAVPSLVSPPDSAINIQLTPTLTWNTATGAEGYHLQISTVSTFATNVVDDTTLTATSKLVGSLALNTTYCWRVRSKNAAGYSAFTNARSFKTILTTGIAKLDGSIPSEHALSQNYPNPFNPSTAIRYDLPKSENVSLNIYNTLGQLVATLVNERKETGHYQATWNAPSVPSGIYFYRLQAGEFVETKKMILLQ